MSRKRQLRIIIIIGIIITLVVGLSALRLVFNCCGLPPPIINTRDVISSDNDSGSFQLVATQTVAFVEGELRTANSSDPVNKTTVALLNQTQTAAYIGSQLQTANATMTLEDFIGTFDAQVNLSLTPNPFTADISPTAPLPTIQIVTVTAPAITPSPTLPTNS